MPKEAENRWNVHALALFAAAAAIILLSTSTKYLEPLGLYFSFSAFLYSYPEQVGLGALLLKLAIPLVVGACAAFLPISNHQATAASAGFVSALVLAWPNVAAWDILAPEELLERRNAFLLVYFFFLVGYSYLAKTGCRLASIYQRWHNARGGSSPVSVGADLLDWDRTVKPSLIAVVSSLFTLVLGQLFAQ